MSTGYSWEGMRQVGATLLGARHVPEHLCGGRVYLGRYIKWSTFLVHPHALTAHLAVRLCHSLQSSASSVASHHVKSITLKPLSSVFLQFVLRLVPVFLLELY